MIDKENEILALHSQATATIELALVQDVIEDLIDRVNLLEWTCEEAINLPKGVEPHSWSDYKIKTEEE